MYLFFFFFFAAPICVCTALCTNRPCATPPPKSLNRHNVTLHFCALWQQHFWKQAIRQHDPKKGQFCRFCSYGFPQRAVMTVNDGKRNKMMMANSQQDSLYARDNWKSADRFYQLIWFFFRPLLFIQICKWLCPEKLWMVTENEAEKQERFW